jgi:hypothetical protein
MFFGQAGEKHYTWHISKVHIKSTTVSLKKILTIAYFRSGKHVGSKWMKIIFNEAT